MHPRLDSRFASLDPALHDLPAELTARLLSPALIVWLAHVRENVRRVLTLTGGPDRWRPHVKTTKLPVVWRELLRAGIRRFKCATLREARVLLETLATEGVSGDVLLAHPLHAPALPALARLAEQHPASAVAVLCEDPDLAPRVPAPLGVFVDVNPGMDRTGLPLEARGDIRRVARATAERFRGVHAYEGHLHGPVAERRERAFGLYARLLELVEELREDGPVPELCTSGTPTFTSALAFEPFSDLGPTLHTVSPGTVVFHDLRSERENPDLDLIPAALLFTRVVSHPAPHVATCDAGSKSLAAEGGHPSAFCLGRPDLEPGVASEEHLPLNTAGPRPPRTTELLLIPWHVCPTTNLAETALVVDSDGTFEAHPVLGRAHDLFAP